MLNWQLIPNYCWRVSHAETVLSFCYLSIHLYLCPAHSFTHPPLSNGFWHEVSDDK